VAEPRWFTSLYIVLSLKLMASEEELKAEIERLRAENASLKKPARGQMSLKGKREGWAFSIRTGSLPGHALSRTMGKAPGHGGRDPHVHSGKRSRLEEKGVTARRLPAVRVGAVPRFRDDRSPSTSEPRHPW
jgi:hypothetical protein